MQSLSSIEAIRVLFTQIDKYRIEFIAVVEFYEQNERQIDITDIFQVRVN